MVGLKVVDIATSEPIWLNVAWIALGGAALGALLVLMMRRHGQIAPSAYEEEDLT